MSQDAYLEVNASQGPAVELLKSIDHGCGFGEFNWCQFEKSGCRLDELGGDIAGADCKMKYLLSPVADYHRILQSAAVADVHGAIKRGFVRG